VLKKLAAKEFLIRARAKNVANEKKECNDKIKNKLLLNGLCYILVEFYNNLCLVISSLKFFGIFNEFNFSIYFLNFC